MNYRVLSRQCLLFRVHQAVTGKVEHIEMTERCVWALTAHGVTKLPVEAR